MGSDDRIGNEAVGEKTEEDSTKKGRPQDQKKVIRLLTVLAYLISVSTPAMVLSTYYVFLWKSPTQNMTTTHHTTH